MGSAPHTNREDAREKTPPWVTFLTPPNPDSKTGGRSLVLAFRPYRSKFTTITCFCKRRRKDGGCRTLDALVPFLAHPDRVRFTHPKVDERVFRPRDSAQFAERANQVLNRRGHRNRRRTQ